MNVATWLCELGLEQYVAAFESNDVDAQTLRELTESDLAALGIVSVGHRRQLATAISALAAPQLGPGVSAPARQTALEAEHRQLSVLYCDMVGSTALSERLDPEEYRDVIRSFHDRCLRTVAEYDGWVANFIGDCMLVYFGWPRAHEDDVERAVRTGLRLVHVVSSSGLAVRVGIATGSVVVGDLIREGPAQEQSAVGVTPDLAAHLQSLAAPGQVAIDELTRRLLGSSFVVKPLGAHGFKGLPESATAYAVSGEQSADSRFDARKGRDVPPMVGRDRELALLKERWAHAQGGDGSALLLVGEAGIGKSRLVRALLDACATRPHQLVRWQCSPYHGGSALWPVIQRLGRAAGLAAEDSTDAALDKLETVVGDQAAALYATLLGLNGTQRYRPLEMTPQMLRDRTLEVLVEQLFEMTDQRPVLLVVEDAHWVDPTTMELIERCLEEIKRARMFILITSRPDNQPELQARPGVMQLSLNRLTRANVETMITHLAGDDTLQTQTLAAIVAQTDGVPLFVEELTKAAMETGDTAIPASLHGSLMARLDRLSEVKEVAQVAACIGREFDLALLRAVSERPDAVGPAISKLVAAELVFQRGDRAKQQFMFKHALVQEAARESLLHKKREALHARILSALEAERPRTPREILAQHAVAAKLAGRAVVHWYEAGKAAQVKSAYVEAVGFFESAAGLIKSQAEGADRLTFEIDLLLRLGQCRMGIYGIGSEASREVFYRANQLLKLATHNQPSRMRVQYGLWNWYYVHAELRKALQLGQEALSAEQVDGAPESLLTAQRMVATTYAYLGDFARANALYEQAMPLVDSERSREITAQFFSDQRISALYQYSVMRCIQGHADHSRQLMRRAHDLCGPLTPALQRAYLFLLAAIRAALERDYGGLETELSVLVEVAGKHRMSPWFDGFIDILSVWAAMECGHPAEQETARCLGGVNKLEASGQILFLPFLMSRLAIGLSACNRHDEASLMIERASTVCDETSQGWCDAEMWRIHGELHLRRETPDVAQACLTFERALELARQRGGRLWELRAAVSMARCWGQRGEGTRALNLLAPVYECFTEGFETRDLVEARALLRDLKDAAIR